MKKTIVTLACCAVLAPLAFAQTSSKDARQGTATAEANNGNGNGHQNDN